MSVDPPDSNERGDGDADDQLLDEGYDPGDTLNRGMSLACGLVLLFFALISCGFIASVLSQRH